MFFQNEGHPVNLRLTMLSPIKNSLVTIAVNDPELMVDKPAALTAATGMDVLTHAIEAIVTPGAYAVTDATDQCLREFYKSIK
jgi:alcohol dehydrogenase